ncbi:MAG: hypothetical protein CVV44_14385 [Spirochaetae bacterium HGW-Spirochaetae-1]|jgi:hypothetical protein|nr:MAG: hypothetical protein CVV44_14385 [Spirochaetae bacterium HGW-Spirochaetae-1]
MKYTRFKLMLTILSLSLTVLTGCVTPMGMTASTTPLQGKEMEMLGKAEGSDTVWSVLGVFPVRRVDIDKAIERAVAQKGGHALINVRWYETTYYFILGSVDKLTVTGDVVRFVEPKPAGKK